MASALFMPAVEEVSEAGGSALLHSHGGGSMLMMNKNGLKKGEIRSCCARQGLDADTTYHDAEDLKGHSPLDNLRCLERLLDVTYSSICCSFNAGLIPNLVRVPRIFSEDCVNNTKVGGAGEQPMKCYQQSTTRVGKNSDENSEADGVGGIDNRSKAVTDDDADDTEDEKDAENESEKERLRVCGSTTSIGSTGSSNHSTGGMDCINSTNERVADIFGRIPPPESVHQFSCENVVAETASKDFLRCKSFMLPDFPLSVSKGCRRSWKSVDPLSVYGVADGIIHPCFSD